MPNAHVRVCLFCVIKHVKCLKPSADLFTLVSMDVVFSKGDFTAHLPKPQFVSRFDSLRLSQLGHDRCNRMKIPSDMFCNFHL